MALSGGCHCGAVRYTAAGEPFERAFCHCTDCRGVSGSIGLPWFTVRETDLTVEGPLARYRSSDKAERGFCATCGTQLTYCDDGYENRIDVTTGSLDWPAPTAADPVEQIFVHSRLPWVAGLANLPERAEDQT